MDMRVPVVLGTESPAPTDAALVVTEEPAGHVPGCGCCLARGSVATALGRLFVARARGEAPWFTRVVARCDTPAEVDALRHALATDPIASARFRLAEGLPPDAKSPGMPACEIAE